MNLKKPKNSQNCKKSKMLHLFNTEDNRSSFGKPSSFPSNGIPSGGPSATQNKTSSSKNKPKGSIDN